jgi:phosphatidylglycerol lysyltransferase
MTVPATAVPGSGRPLGAGPRARPAWIAPAIVVALFALSAWVLRRELHAYDYHELLRATWAMPRTRLALAALATLAAYAVLPGYDALALRYVGRRIALGRVAVASWTAYALSQTLGFPVLTGGSVRYRFWSGWGMDSAEIARAVSFAGLTFTLGMAMMASVTLLLEPAATLALIGLPAWLARPVGALGVASVAAYLWWSATRTAPVRIRGWELAVPPLPLAVQQLALACLDWVFAALVMYALLPAGSAVGFVPFLGAFLLAHAAGVLSHVPGGLGVFETLMLLLLTPQLPTPAVLAALLGFRVLYYLVPFGLGIVALVASEARRQRALVARGVGAIGRLAPTVIPTALGTLIFAAGLVLLVSGATPPVGSRLRQLVLVVPLQFVDMSHFVGSMVGAALLVLAWAARRRVRVAWVATVALLVLGIVTSLAKGLDWEEALLLGGVLAIVVAARRAFDRPALLMREPLTPGWIAATAAVAIGVTLLVLFSYKHVEYRDALWWRVGTGADASRSLRTLLGAGGTLAAFGLLRLLTPAQPDASVPDDAALADAARIAATDAGTEGWLALLGDKTLLFDEARTGFVMYAVEGRSWVALGDPVGAPAARADLAWRFREEALRHGGWPVFYEVPAESLPLYVDLGLTLLKLGEEAIVPLDEFSLEGGHRKGFRRTIKEVERAGVVFEVHPASDVPSLLPQLRRISDEWLAGKAAREKGFSLGRFDEAYLVHFPVAVARRGDTIVAFANVLQGGDGEELSVDLMRYSDDAPSGVMEYLFVQLMLHGRAQGRRRFNLGMAPMSGFEERRGAPIWQAMGTLLFRHGEHFYNFRGLRAYKQKFDPVWTPRYLASPGGLALPRILANVASLIGGGLTGVVRK